MRRLIVIVILFCLNLLVFLGCKEKAIKNEVKQVNNRLLYGLATGLGGLGDSGYNDILYNGMVNAKQKYDIDFVCSSPIIEENAKKTLQDLIDLGAKIIIAGGGWFMVEPVDELARKYPDLTFILLDDYAKEYLSNISSVICNQNEGSYLVGALAALHSKTKVIGMVGAINRPIINDFWVGFEAGAKKVYPQIEVLLDYITNYDTISNPFDNQLIAYQIADKMYRKDNVDIIFQVASASGIGVFNAARDNDCFAIGVDADQDYLLPGSILTSMMRRFDIVMEFLIDNIQNERFENKAYTLGIDEGSVTLSPMDFTLSIIDQEHLNIIKELKKQILNRTIIVPTTF